MKLVVELDAIHGGCGNHTYSQLIQSLLRMAADLVLRDNLQEPLRPGGQNQGGSLVVWRIEE